MRRRIRHPAPAARGTEAAALAREGDQAVVTTGVAVDAQEPVREHATAKEGAKLLLDEAGSGLLSVCSAREEASELLANDLMKESLLGLMALVLGNAVPGRDRVGAPRKKLEPIGPHGTRATRRSDAVALRAMEAVPRALSIRRVGDRA
jgi:hypothetical protein